MFGCAGEGVKDDSFAPHSVQIKVIPPGHSQSIFSFLRNWASRKRELHILFTFEEAVQQLRPGPENYKSLRRISGGYPAENFSSYYIIYVLQQTFTRFVDFLYFQLISLIRWNLSIDW